MSTLLVKKASILVAKDDQRREITGGGLFILRGKFKQVGPTGELPSDANEILDLSGSFMFRGGQIIPHDLPKSIEEHNQAARHLILN